MKKTLILLSFLALFACKNANKTTILVEAESFENKGGWVVDQQWMDQMGSPYLLAHGLGEPVKDAVTTVRFSKLGGYKVWVRTKDWVAVWNAPGAPGKFQVLVNGQPLDSTFGTSGADWHWQYGGTVNITSVKNEISLRDLTGFEGRCDAIVFSCDSAVTLPNEGTAMKAWRRALLDISSEPEDGGEYDLVVVGGGIAGMCSALSAARLGLKVALVQDRPVPGGNNSSEVRVWLGGKTNFEPYPRIGDIVKELQPAVEKHYGPENTGAIYEDDKRMHILYSEENLKMFMNCRVNQVEMDGQTIKAVIGENIENGRITRFRAKNFVDCTGDAVVGYLAKADFDSILTRHMGFTNVWSGDSTPNPVSFPHCEWALDLKDKPFPGRKNDKGNYGEVSMKALGVWYWESGVDWDPIRKGEEIRDWNFRAMYGAWDALKNVDSIYPNHKLKFSAYISGKRESRQLLGDHILNKQELLDSAKFEDACLPCTWDMDLHLPRPEFETGFEGKAFITVDYHTPFPRPYWMPYRCLYSRNITNLFMAGRNISVTHEALGTVRVMRTGGMMGEIVGMAAKICKERQCTPRDVYAKYLADLKSLMIKGVGKEQIFKEDVK